MGEAPHVAVLVPMLGRAHLAQPLADSLRGSDPNELARLVFIVGAGDGETRQACADTGCDVLDYPRHRERGDYQRKINFGCERTVEEFVFTGASDLVFHPGWVTHALRRHRSLPHPGVVGTNDLGNPMVRRGRASTHSLVHRDYLPHAVIDQPGNLYCTLYDHNYCDMELVDYATRQRRFIFAALAKVEHLHPDWKKAVWDETYTDSKRHFREDQRLWQQRRLLWRPKTQAQARAEARARLRQRV